MLGLGMIYNSALLGSCPFTAVRLELNHMGKFQTDICPRHIFIIPPSMITSFTFTIFYCHLIGMSYGEKGQEIAAPFSPLNKEVREFQPSELPLCEYLLLMQLVRAFSLCGLFWSDLRVVRVVYSLIAPHFATHLTLPPWWFSTLGCSSNFTTPTTGTRVSFARTWPHG